MWTRMVISFLFMGFKFKMGFIVQKLYWYVMRLAAYLCP